MSTIGERIKLFAKENYGSVSSLSRAMGIKETSLSTYINGRSKPGASIQDKLRSVGMDIEWLMTGIESSQYLWRGLDMTVYGTNDPPVGTHTKLMLSPAHCGDAEMVHDSVAAYIDMSKFHNKDTFYVRATGESMIGAGIHDGDMLLVDVAKEPKNGNIVLVRIGDAVSVKRLKKNGEDTLLTPEHPEHEPIAFSKDTHILAVVLRIDKYLI